MNQFSAVRRISVLLVLVCLLPAANLFAQSVSAKDHTAILDIMARQEACWNKGDLNCFMEGYWPDDSLKFIGKSGITYGWDATLERYQKGYPDKAAMGKLTFTILHVDAVSKKAAQVTGKWHLQRESDAPQGYFTLLWRKIKGEWVIVADHSS
jgi:ketosteroid isomerase-like protein